MENRLTIDGKRRRWPWTVVALCVGGGLVLLMVLAALPLPGPLSRAREAWWKHAAERRATVEGYEKNGWPDDDDTPAGGKIHMEDQAGAWDYAPRSCDSGQLHAFYGVTVRDPVQTDVSVRIVVPESGEPHVTVAQKDHDDLTFERPACKLWDVAVEDTHSYYNNVRNLKGHARFDCVAHGEHLTGNVELRSCH